ncbi:predicted protein [Histoplasma mississippiense (nom. inval.)]|uniref:predicted protein n=1 Tax=Ajellomyces capsulatus (strain NAm1 / WU24) TaxID=2059318 RepID=UPI000157BF42|nr:predicted protein [Histoplasma mississippiense (nom. inval.)]EDN06379.1 predicted protein [Histoplasma mississippiense (nom. inval.)]
MSISGKHLRIYTIIFDNGNPGEVGPLVYAQNLSRYGSVWKSVITKREDAAVLLSDGDMVELSQFTSLTFRAREAPQVVRFKDRYIISNRLLGCGAYGKVYMAVSIKYRKQLACKIIDIGGLKKRLYCIKLRKHTELRAPRPAAEVDVEEEMEKVKYWADRRRETLGIEAKLEIYQREVDILKDLDHPNIVKLEQVIMGEKTVYIFQELVTAGDLFSFLEYKKFNLSDSEAAVIVRQVAVAISYLHGKNIVHRDIKPDNVLMTSLSDGARVVLTDFGCARRLEKESSRMKTSIGTLEYTAPEVPQSEPPCKGKGYTKAVDMWSLGCLTVVLLTGGSPFTDPDTGQYCQKMARNCDLRSLEQEKDWQRVGLRAKSFVRKLLVLDENVRMTADQAVSHKWFTNPAYKREFEDLSRRAAMQWRPKERQVISKEDIDDHASRNSLTFWKKSDDTPLEWPYKPYPYQVHEILYSQQYPAKEQGREALRCVDIKKERRIYPCGDIRPQAPQRVGSITFSQMEMADTHRISTPTSSSSEMGEKDVNGVWGGAGTGTGAGEVGANAKEAQAMDSTTLKKCISNPPSRNYDDNGNDAVEEIDGSRLRMPFSPNAWIEEPKQPSEPEQQQQQQQKHKQRQYHQLPEPISVLTRSTKTTESQPHPPLPQSAHTLYFQPLKTGPNGFTPTRMPMPITHNHPNDNRRPVTRGMKPPDQKVRTFVSLAREIRFSEISSGGSGKVTTPALDGNNSGGGDGDVDGCGDDYYKKSRSSSSPPRPRQRSPRKRNGGKRSIYDFLEDSGSGGGAGEGERTRCTRRSMIRFQQKKGLCMGEW